MNKILKIAYWVSTAFVVLVCLGSGVFNIMQNEDIKAVYLANKLPLYLAPFLGVLKILGGLTIVLPFLKRFHEAAYAGLIFYFIGATYVVIASGGPAATYGFCMLILLFVIISYLTSLKRTSIN
jgi:uncharacterized membrane protein YphA (DoxX/SURF4 family)